MTFLTGIPLKVEGEVSPSDLWGSMGWYPLVGLAMGFVAWVVYAGLDSFLPGLVAATLVVILLELLTRGLPWFAVASAGAANVLAMRYKEGVEGITVYDPSGAPAGTSVAAGKACLAQVALTRVVLPIPILLLPPFVLDAARAAPGLGGVMTRSPAARLGVELGVFAVFLQCALPFAVALFPQTGSIPASSLEPEFRGRVDAATGRAIDAYTFNKGV